MHRTYQPILPSTSKLLQQKWDTEYYNAHRKKVDSIKATVDTRPPKTYMHLHLKLKKLQLEDERMACIERDNRILLEKMAYITRKRGRVDHRNNYDSRSLNIEKRRRELIRVTQENRDILRRIESRQPQYDRRVWLADWDKNLEYMDSISAFPRDWWLQLKAEKAKHKKQKKNASGKENTAKANDNSKDGDKQKAPEDNEEKGNSKPSKNFK